MLLQRLVEYAKASENTIPIFHRDQEFKWQLDLATDGQPASELLAVQAVDDSGRGVRHATPVATRTVGIAPNLAADDIQYVLGWADPKVKPDRVAKCHQAFIDLHRRWAEERGAEDPDAQAVVAFYAEPVGSRITRPPEFTAKDRVLISVEGRLLYQRPTVPAFWAEEVARRKGGARVGLCLVCGKTAPLLDTVPGKIPARWLPGASNDAALISINEPVFGYDLSEQLSQCPICLDCGEAVSVGLLGVLEGHSNHHGGQDSRTAWWVVGETGFDPVGMCERPEPDDVAHFLSQLRAGRRPQPVATDPDSREPRFYSLTVAGNVARVMVRDWVQMPLAQVEERVAKWFNDHEVVATSADGRRHHSLHRLILACGRWDRQRNCYADLGTKAADRPPDTRRRLHEAATQGRPLPHALLIHLLHRIATDGRLDDPRASLIRLCLVRHPQTSPESVPMPDLEPTGSDPAYVAGRIFAVLEQIQYDSADPKPNTTFGDRYFAGALAGPRTAITVGRKDAAAWLRKLRRARPGAAVNHEKHLSEIFSLLGEHQEIPARCNPRQQARFVLGYHHERSDHFTNVRDRSARREDAKAAGQSVTKTTSDTSIEENDR
jgi:CRISPR-associated protein Csd1